MLKSLVIITILVTTTLGQWQEPIIKPYYEWKTINYAWPSNEAYMTAIKNETYIPKNNVITGIKIWKDKMYLTIPRLRNGVPVTLAVTSTLPINNQTSPNLEPYPNWDMQREGNCSALQFVQNIEIDPQGKMWILDTGRTAIMTSKSESKCPPRLVILDLEKNGAIVKNYIFPHHIADPQNVYLKDLVIDHEDGGYAYITDSDNNSPGIIVYSFKNDMSWKITHETMKAQHSATINFMIDMIRINQSFNVGGIALSPLSTEGNRTLYYTPLSSYEMYAVSTNVLKNDNMRTNFGQYVKKLGRKASQTDGMIMSNTGILFFGSLGDNAISMWDSNYPNFSVGQRNIFKDQNNLQWPSSFSFDDKGQLWSVSNRLQKFLNNSTNINETNYRVLVSNVNMMSYQYKSPINNNNNNSNPNINGSTAGKQNAPGKANSFTQIEPTIVSMMMILLVFLFQ